jgi:enterochelin esterase-like enzyme
MGSDRRRYFKEPTPMAPTAGELVTEALEYDEGRLVTVYVPPDPAEAVVFAADGAWHITRLSEVLECASAPPTMIVGVHGLSDDDGRLHEYVPGFDAQRFAAHEKFFVGDVGRWVASRFGVALRAERTGVWGASLGGELALAMGLRHPDVYGAVLSASPGAGFLPPEVWPSPLPRVYLVAGRHEQFFLDNATRWADALRNAGTDVAMVQRDGEHGGAFWVEEFPLMVAWAFGH